jgi:Zn-dependent peptidase ImmA (M78 family)
MDLTLYKPTETERWINKTYQSSGIQYASDLDIDIIADLFNIEVHFREGKSFIDFIDDFNFIVINALLDTENRRKDFFHELGHFILHCGKQDNMTRLFKELQEMQADQFQLYASMPYYMLEEFKYVPAANLVKVLSEAFVLPEAYVKKRLEQIKNRMYWQEQDLNLKERLNRKVTITKQSFQEFVAETHRRYDERYGKTNEDTCVL